MVKVEFDPYFKRKFKRIKDAKLREKIKKQIRKVIATPQIGKPMRSVRKGTRELYIAPYRLSYSYDKKNHTIILLDFYHKKKQ